MNTSNVKKERQIKYEKSRKIMVKHEDNKSVTNSVKDRLNEKLSPDRNGIQVLSFFYLFICLFLFVLDHHFSFI